jgi:hypothetical protein
MRISGAISATLQGRMLIALPIVPGNTPGECFGARFNFAMLASCVARALVGSPMTISSDLGVGYMDA